MRGIFRDRGLGGWLLLLFAFILLATGMTLSIGGAELCLLGGSPYYLAAGLALLAAGTLLALDRPAAPMVYAATVIVTVCWSLWEVGFDGWALVPRLVGPAVLLLVLALFARVIRARAKRFAWPAIGLAALSLAVAAGGVVLRPSFAPAATRPMAGSGPAGDADWTAFGGNVPGTRFSEAAQITPANIGRLDVAWTYRTGEMPTGIGLKGYEVTPIKIGDSLYLCTPGNVVIALDAATGRERWRFDPKVPIEWGSKARICRGVTHYTTPPDADGRCADHIVSGTNDMRLIALDARDGRPCAGFGQAGQIDLKRGMGSVVPGSAQVTTPPTVAGGLLITGAYIMDNQRTDPPSGVIRAFDARTGALRWAWDMGRPDRPGEPPDGGQYTRGTPNSWIAMAADEALGLVYVPLGNPGADYFSGNRAPYSRRFGTSLVALDLKSGQPRWSFQAVHNDMWDYDLGTQPALVDWPTPGGPIPAVVQATKTAQLFVLDRRSGRPIVPVVERRVITRAAPGEQPSPTQPFSAMPDLGGADLTEKDSWGISPIDQMLCRIQFRRAFYRGRYTPLQADRPAIQFPYYGGGMDWGGIAVDPVRGLILVNSTRMANRGFLIPHPDPSRVTALGDPGVTEMQVAPFPQKGTPYAAVNIPWTGEAGVPCIAPPWGHLTAIDIRTRRIVWQRPLGDASRSGPWRIPSLLPVAVGTPITGGPFVTRGGVTFVASTVDEKFRAFDTATGRLLWERKLPAGGQSSPSTYTIGGRQYVVIAAGGHAGLGTTLGDYVIAYRLKD